MELFFLIVCIAIVLWTLGGAAQDRRNLPPMPPGGTPQERREMQAAKGTLDCLTVVLFIVGGAALLLFTMAGGAMVGG